MASKRDYKREYEDYHGTPEQIARRSQRNKARRTAEAEGSVRKGDSREVHHTANNRKGALGSKTKVVSKKENRRKQPKRDGSQD